MIQAATTNLARWRYDPPAASYNLDRNPRTWSPCNLHLTSGLPLEGTVGVVDRVDRRFADHNVIVVFHTIVTRPFGEPWVDGFTADELELVEPRYAF